MDTTDTLFLALVYVVPMAGIWALYLTARWRRHATAARLLEESRECGLTEPPSLHPVIDYALCLGCGSCASACPEHGVLGILAGRAVLVQPANCIGHGACKDACPQDAIRLVLGTQRRGVEVPVSGPDFETNVRGLFVAGEIGGMGLIRNAIAQGVQAMDSAARYSKDASGDDRLDVVIVGAGPAGLAASLRAHELGLRFVTLEQETLGGTVAHYPRGKIVMTAPVELPCYGSVKLRETSKEALLELWTHVIDQTGLQIDTGQRVSAVRSEQGGLVVETEQAVYPTRAVILCIGRRGTPRRLGVSGEELDKVVYRLVDPEQYAGRRVLVVGGGDSALEAAIALSEQPDTDVTLSYRGQAFSRAKPANRQRIEAAADGGAVQVLLGAKPEAIFPGSVEIDVGVGTKELANDAVIVCIGGVLPTGFLREAGVEIEVRYGE